jgi:hypothetical protein
MRKLLTGDHINGYKWVEVDNVSTFSNPDARIKGEDLSVDSYISKYGGIKSIITDEVFSSKRSYENHLKSHNKTIKDW